MHDYCVSLEIDDIKLRLKFATIITSMQTVMGIHRVSELIAYIIMCADCNHFLAEMFCNHASANFTG